MKTSKTNIYDKEGIENTEATLKAVKKKAEEDHIDQIVLATTTGATALSCAEMMPEIKTIAAVTMHAIDKEIKVKRHGKDVLAKSPELMKKAREKGVKFYTGIHPFRGAVASSVNEKFGGFSAHDIIAETLMSFFSTGTKVAVESTLMAADGGLIDISKDVIAMGGYRGGADTALLLKPSFSYRLFDLKVKEIIAMPASCY
jgi:hypothetical protein